VAGVIGHKALTQGLFQHLLEGEKAMKLDAQDAALEAAIAGEEAVRHTIDHTESSLSPGKMNRNWTYAMHNAVDSRVDRNGNTISIRVGWLQTKKGYFLIQEHGGQVHGTTVEPMLALMAGHKAVLDTLKGWGIKVQ
jgi:hypothetical protein